MRRTKATFIYPKIKKIDVAQLLLGYKRLESTVRYLGVKVDDALDILETIEAQLYLKQGSPLRAILY